LLLSRRGGPPRREGIIVRAPAPENLSLAATLVYPYKKYIKSEKRG